MPLMIGTTADNVVCIKSYQYTQLIIENIENFAIIMYNEIESRNGFDRIVARERITLEDEKFEMFIVKITTGLTLGEELKKIIYGVIQCELGICGEVV